jgi:hypothetical protein
LPLGSAVPTENKKNSRKRPDLPGSWVTLCTYAALYDPGRIFVPSHEDEPTRGVAVAGDFRLRPQSLPVPQSALPRCLAASRHVDVAPALQNDEGSSNMLDFGAQSRGLSTRCLRFAARLTTDHARLACSWWPTFAARDWLPAGLLSRFQRFIASSSAKLAWRNSNSNLKMD